MMANHTRHFKIGFYGQYLLERNGPHVYELQGLFDFLVSGMRFTYDPIVEGIREIQDLVDRSEIDIAIAQVGVLEESMKDVNLNYPFCIDEITFAVRNPEHSPRIMALFQTLSLTVWLWLLASTILFALVCYVALKHRHTFQDVLLHVLAICLNQEGNIVSKRAADFILLCTWLVAMAFFTLCFKSVLLSFLSFPPAGGIRTVPELAAAIRAGEYIAYTPYGNELPKVLSKSPNEDIRVIGESMNKSIRGGLGYMFVEHIEANYPAFPKKAFVYVRSHMSFPGVYVSKDNMLTSSTATFVREDFSYKEEVDMLVHRFLASGIDTKMRNFRKYSRFIIYTLEFQRYNIPYEVPDEDKNRQLTMTDLAGAFILLAAGNFLAVCVLFIELLTKRRKTSLFKKKKNNLRMIPLFKRAQSRTHTDPHSNVSHS